MRTVCLLSESHRLISVLTFISSEYLRRCWHHNFICWNLHILKSHLRNERNLIMFVVDSIRRHPSWAAALDLAFRSHHYIPLAAFTAICCCAVCEYANAIIVAAHLLVLRWPLLADLSSFSLNIINIIPHYSIFQLNYRTVASSTLDVGCIYEAHNIR